VVWFKDPTVFILIIMQMYQLWPASSRKAGLHTGYIFSVALLVYLAVLFII
jgi:hypothetical protein